MQYKNLKILVISSAGLIFINILIGTLGAHLWQNQLIQHQGVANFATARDYLFVHSLAILFLALLDNKFPHLRFNLIAVIQLVFICLFSGSLILYALTGDKGFSQITPLGGSGLMLSWLLLIWRVSKIK